MDAGTAGPTEVSCLDVAGSRVCAEHADDVLVVRVRLAEGTRAAVYVDGALVAGEDAERPAGRHRRPEPD